MTNQLDQNDTQRVISLLKKKTLPRQIADICGLPLSTVMSVMSRVVKTDLGRPELQQHIVSFTRAGTAWPEEDEVAINLARMQYDAGLVELCQGREGQFIILYAIPNKQPAAERHYFSKPPQAL